MNTTGLIGYVASAFVVLSLAMTSVVRLRMISLVGALAFIVYGVRLGSPPIVVTNGSILLLNVWFLRQELGGKRSLGATIVPADDPFLVDFLRYHLTDIHRFQPTFTLEGPPPELQVAMLLMRDGLPAGALIGRVEQGELRIALDYVTKPYRDSQISTWLYGKGSGVFRRLGIDRISTEPGTEPHIAYLAKCGFHRAGDRFRLELQ